MTSSYWKRRALVYDNLAWAKHDKFIQSILVAGKLQKTDVVLDAGTGTGIIAKAVAPLVNTVIAMDASPHMLNLVPSDDHKIVWCVGDLRDVPYDDGYFDAIIARYVFHHIIERTEKAMSECYRVLRPGGVIVFAEGPPPSRRTRQDFIDIFALKEDRITFMPSDMRKLLLSAGFKIVSTKNLWLRQMSIRNWVESGGVPKKVQDIIFAMHRNAAQYFKDDYHMTETDNDCLIDMKITIMTGVKTHQ